MSGADIIPFRYPKRVLREPSGYLNLPLSEAPAALMEYDRVAIVGGPGSGKTYLANQMAKKELGRSPHRETWCSDVLWDIPWKDQPVEIARRLIVSGNWVAEGIGVLRSLRNGLLAPQVVVLRDIPIRPLGDVQGRLWYQCQRWWKECLEKQPLVYRIVPGELSRP